jgi:hypothetical protein
MFLQFKLASKVWSAHSPEMEEPSDYDKQQAEKRDFWIFTIALLKHWEGKATAILGCAAIVFYQDQGSSLPSWLLGFVTLGCLLLATFATWRDERVAKEKQRVELTAKITGLEKSIATADEKLYQEVLDRYIADTLTLHNSLNRLAQSGAAKLKSEQEIIRLCDELAERQGVHPLQDWEAIPVGKLLKAINEIRDRHINMDDPREAIDFLMRISSS